MLTILLIVLVVVALGGFGHSGYHRGYYGGRSLETRGNGLGGGVIGLLAVLVVLYLLFGHGGAVGPSY